MSQTSLSGQQQARQVHPVALLPVAAATDEACGAALARAFAADGWRVGLVYDRRDSRLQLAAQAICEALVEAGYHASLALPLDVSQLILASNKALGTVKSGNNYAADWLADLCDPVSGFGTMPLCLVTAPTYIAEDGAGASAADVLLAAMQANVAVPLELADAFAAAWRQFGATMADASIIHLLDKADVTGEQKHFSFGLSQTALLAAIPAQARAVAPQVRVTGLRAPLMAAAQCGPWQASGADMASDAGGATLTAASDVDAAAVPRASYADVADAACYLARAASITGSTLLVDSCLTRAELPHRRADASFTAEEKDANRLP